MKVRIQSIKIPSTYRDGESRHFPDFREVTAREVRPESGGELTINAPKDKQDLTFILPQIEVDHQLIVGGVYELVFARREG